MRSIAALTNTAGKTVNQLMKNGRPLGFGVIVQISHYSKGARGFVPDSEDLHASSCAPLSHRCRPWQPVRCSAHIGSSLNYLFVATLSARTDPDFKTPGASRGLFDVFTHRYLLSLLLRKGITTRYYGSVLGWVWSYIRPAALFLMYFLIVGLIFGVNKGIDAYAIYLFSGIVAINLFNEVLRNATTAITDNAALVQKIYMPRELFPVAAAGVALVHFLPQALLLLVVVLFSGWTFGWLAVLSLIGGIVIIMTFSLGLGLFFGAINVQYRDATNIVDLILMFSTWASPVLYSSKMVKEIAPEWVYHIYMSNPITAAVELFHNAFWLPVTPESARPENLIIYVMIGLLISAFTLFIGQLTFRKAEGNFAQAL